MKHLDDGRLLELALRPGALPDAAAHLAGCAECEAARSRIAVDLALVRACADVDDPTADCIDDIRMASLAAGALEPTARALVIAHVAECSHCRRRLAAISRALSDPVVVRELGTAATVATHRPLVRPVLVAAAMAAVVMLMVAPPQRESVQQAPHRAPTITAGGFPAPVAPAGVVASAERLRWAGVAGVDRYRVTLFDMVGTVLFETELLETDVVLPDSIVLEPGRSYLWKVEARTGWDRWTPSPLIEFAIGRSAPSRP